MSITAPSPTRSIFEITSWTTVLQARQDDSDGQAALERLLTRYYGPIRRIIQIQQRCGNDQADDLTQEFFRICLERDFLKAVEPAKGRFRTFVQTCIRNFLRDQHKKTAAKKRAEDPAPLPACQVGVEGQPLVDPAAEVREPGELIDCAWARHVVGRAVARLEQHCLAEQRMEYFQELKDQLTQRDSRLVDTAKIAARLGIEESTVHVARHRLRKRLGEFIKEEIQDTVEPGGNWREELHYLMKLAGQ